LASGCSADAQWTPCGPDDAELLGSLNAQLAEDEGAQPIGPPSAYITRMRGWLEQGRYQAATARRGGEVLAYVLWRDDLDYGDIFIVLPHDPRLSASHNQSARWPPLLLNEDIEG